MNIPARYANVAQMFGILHITAKLDAGKDYCVRKEEYYYLTKAHWVNISRKRPRIVVYFLMEQNI